MVTHSSGHSLLQLTYSHVCSRYSTRLYTAAAARRVSRSCPTTPRSLEGGKRATVWPIMSGGWDKALEVHARRKDPAKELGSDVLLKANENVMTIFDGYEKSRFHFLVLPRDPFTLSSGKTLHSSSLTTLHALRKSPHAMEVLQALQQQGEEVKAMIEDEMMKREGWVWPVHMGFHGVESMRHVHLHVISSDMISDRLKNKKHYNSFHPTLGYFLHLPDVLSQVSLGQPDPHPASHYAALEKQPLVSFYTGEEFKTIPKLKDHLVAEFEKQGRAAKRKMKREREAEEAAANEAGA